MPRTPRMSRTVRTVVAVVAGAALFGAAGFLAGQATGVQNSSSPVPVAKAPAPSSGPDVASVPGAPSSAPAAPGSVTTTTAAPLPPLGTKVAIVGDSLTEGVRSRITPFAARYGFDAAIDA